MFNPFISEKYKRCFRKYEECLYLVLKFGIIIPYIGVF